MEAVFDHAASTYDKVFTHSHIGRLQRARVHEHLDPYLNTGNSKQILELNCGTGEDALFFAKLGHEVIATDISSSMIEKAKSKIEHSEYKKLIDLKVGSIQEISETQSSNSVDLIFSNFGGFNCLNPSDLSIAIKKSSDILRPGGRMIAIVMPQKCIMETLYFLLKGKRKEFFRRQSDGPVSANVEGKSTEIYYYDPSFFKGIESMKVLKVLPIGFFLPPSFLESYVQPKKVLMKVLYRLEKIVGSWSFLSKYSDHFYIELERK